MPPPHTFLLRKLSNYPNVISLGAPPSWPWALRKWSLIWIEAVCISLWSRSLQLLVFSPSSSLSLSRPSLRSTARNESKSRRNAISCAVPPPPPPGFSSHSSCCSFLRFLRRGVFWTSEFGLQKGTDSEEPLTFRKLLSLQNHAGWT